MSCNFNWYGFKRTMQEFSEGLDWARRIVGAAFETSREIESFIDDKKLKENIQEIFKPRQLHDKKELDKLFKIADNLDPTRRLKILAYAVHLYKVSPSEEFSDFCMNIIAILLTPEIAAYLENGSESEIIREAVTTRIVWEGIKYGITLDEIEKELEKLGVS